MQDQKSPTPNVDATPAAPPMLTILESQAGSLNSLANSFEYLNEVLNNQYPG